MVDVNFLISGWLAGFERALLIRLVSIDPWVCAVVLGLVLVFWIAGWRLARFSHPAHARWSLLVRHLAKVFVLWPAHVFLIIAVLVMSLVVGLALCLGWQADVWGLLSHHLKFAAMGLACGALLGGFLYYWLIPGFEQPSPTGFQEKSPVAHKSYDPEKYFHV